VSGDVKPSRFGPAAPVAAALLAVLVLIGYLRTGFLIDDSFLLARAAHPFGFEVLDFALRTTDHRIHLWVHQDPVVFEFFRPLCALSLWIERRIWGMNAWGYHLTNLILHLANAWMLSRLAFRFGLRRDVALLGALAWALCIQVIPAAGWISGRTEVLWCSCALIATISLLRWRDGDGSAWFAASLVASGLAACAKESGLVTPLLGLLAVRCSEPRQYGGPIQRLDPRRVALLVLPSVVVVAMRLAFIGLSLPPEPYRDVPHGPLDAAWFAVKPGLYLSAALLSLPLSHWGPLEWMHTHPWSLAVVVPAGLLAAFMLGRAVDRSSSLMWLGWFALALLPVMPVRPTSMYLYVPMMGLAMLVATALQRSHRVVYAAWLIITVLVGSGAHLFTQRYIEGVWRTSKSQVATVDRWIQERGASRVVAIDTPVWLYGLPAAVEMESPDLRFDTWFVNFRPRLNAIDGSSVRWRNDLQLEITAPPGGFLHSLFEQFLAFGGAPPDGPHPRRQPLEVAIEGPRTNPQRLVVTFRDRAVRDSALIVRFTHDGLGVVEPVGGPRRAPDAGVVRSGASATNTLGRVGP
jgi:hypothetical protein